MTDEKWVTQISKISIINVKRCLSVVQPQLISSVWQIIIKCRINLCYYLTITSEWYCKEGVGGPAPCIVGPL